ncbi:serine O-acetyltransferase [Streptomyces sp. NBC_00328]|uniref:serine O-acetyltransferase n=1 Tax=Streptomyces sp. NBC_00328 TaxID=2903646 RepID=UPI002E28DBA7|nr:serine O-acetyltransferase [Streptomyces sp. NBC_00328]
MKGTVPIRRIQADMRTILQPVSKGLARAGLTPARAVELMPGVPLTVLEDLYALTTRDPAARSSAVYAYESYLSFRALVAHRVAHELHRLGAGMPDRQGVGHSLATAARCIAEAAKVETGVEIHPAAMIGSRMVIDHGYGTVIGEQVRVGADCYLLQNVVLGARAIRSTPDQWTGRRHPRIGNRVEIAGNVAVFGPVTIGDDCRIEAGARIVEDVPAGSKVRVVSVVQVTTRRSGIQPESEACAHEAGHVMLGANGDTPGRAV